jgi:hypothetical protein
MTGLSLPPTVAAPRYNLGFRYPSLLPTLLPTLWLHAMELITTPERMN